MTTSKEYARRRQAEHPASRQDQKQDTVAPFCDDCQRSQNLPIVGKQHYGRCSYCKIIRACWGDPPEIAS